MPERDEGLAGTAEAAGSLEARAPGSPGELEEYYRLRWRLLRAPWRQPPASERDDFEEQAIHRLVCDGSGRVIAVGRLHRVPNDPEQGQIRYMAVDPAWRGCGLGHKLLNSLEAEARSLGLARIALNAREDAAAFYARHGYEILGTAHTLFGVIRHLKMAKSLAHSEPTQLREPGAW